MSSTADAETKAPADGIDVGSSPSGENPVAESKANMTSDADVDVDAVAPEVVASSDTSSSSDDDDDDGDALPSPNVSPDGASITQAVETMLAAVAPSTPTRRPPSPPTSTFLYPSRVTSPPASCASSLSSFPVNHFSACPLPPIPGSISHYQPSAAAADDRRLMRCCEEPPECDEETTGRRTRAMLEPDVDDDEENGNGGGANNARGAVVVATAVVPCDASAHGGGSTGFPVGGNMNMIMNKNKPKFGGLSSTKEPPGQNVSKETLSNHFAKCGKSRVDPSCIDEVPALLPADGGLAAATVTGTAPLGVDVASVNAGPIHRVVEPERNANSNNNVVDARSMARVASATKQSKGRDPSVVMPLPPSYTPGSSTKVPTATEAMTTRVAASMSDSPESQFPNKKNHRMAEPPSSSSSIVSHGHDRNRNDDQTHGHAAQPSIHNIHMNARGHVYLDGEDDEVASASSSIPSKKITKEDDDDVERAKSPGGRLESSRIKDKGKDPKSTVYIKTTIVPHHSQNHPDDELSKTSTLSSGHYHPAYKAVVSGTAISTSNNAITTNNNDRGNLEGIRHHTGRDAPTIGGDSHHGSIASNQSFNASRYPSRLFPTPQAATSYKGIKNGIANVMSNDRVGRTESEVGEQLQHQNQLHHYKTQCQNHRQRQPPSPPEEAPLPQKEQYRRRDPSSSTNTHYDFEHVLDSSESQATVDSYNASKKAITERKCTTAKGRVMHFDKASYGVRGWNGGGQRLSNGYDGGRSGVNGRADGMRRNDVRGKKGRGGKDDGVADYFEGDVPDMASVAASIDRSLNSIDGDDLIVPSECGGEDCGTADAHYAGDGRRDSVGSTAGSLGSNDTQSLRRTVSGHSGGGRGVNHSKGGGTTGQDMVNSRRRASIEKAKDSDIESLSGGRRGGAGYHNGGIGISGNNNRVSFADQTAQQKSSSSSRKSKETNTKEPSFQSPASSWKRPSSLSGGGAFTDVTNGSSHRASSKSKGGQTSYVKKYSALLTALAVTMCVSIGSMFGSSSLSLSGLVSDQGGDSSLARNQRELKDNGQQERDVRPAKGIMDNVHPTTTGQFSQSTGPDGSGNGDFDWSKVPPHLRGYYAKIFGLQQQQKQIQQEAEQRQQQQQAQQEQQQVMPQVYDQPMPELGITDLQNELASIQNEIDRQYVNINAANAIQNVGNEGMSVTDMPQEIPPSNQGQVSSGEIPMMSYDDWKRQQDIEEGRAQEQAPFDANAVAQEQQLQQQAADEAARQQQLLAEEAARQQQQAAEEEAARERERVEAEEKAIWEKQQAEEAARLRAEEAEAARLRAEEEEAARQRAADEAANEKRELEQLAMIEQEVARRKDEEEAAKQAEEAKAREEAELAAEAERAAVRAKEQEAQRVAAAEEEQRKAAEAEAQANVGKDEARRQEELEERKRKAAAEARRRQQDAEEWMKKNAETPNEDAAMAQVPEEGRATPATLDQLQSEISELMAMMQQKAGGLRKRG